MKKKIIIIIVAICLVVAFLAFLIINRFANNNNTNTNSNNNGITFKDFTFKITEGVKFKKLNDNEFELTTDKWHANFEIMYDEYDHILSYPRCTKKRFSDMGYQTSDELKKNEGDKRTYFTFELVDGSENNIILHYRIAEKYIMFASLINNDNSFDESGLETIFNILKTAKYSGTKKNKYHSYLNEFYHQCHDIDKYDAADFAEQ